MKIQELMEEIKGWKHAHRDLAKWRSQARAAAQPVKLVRLKKDGTESKLHDAVTTFDTEQAAREYHNRLVRLNPTHNIKHNLYVNHELSHTWEGHSDDNLAETATAGATAAGGIATVAQPMGAIQRRPSLFGYVKTTRKSRKRGKTST
jgi:hypothetical protein